MRTKYNSNRELTHIWANDPDPSVYKSANSMSCEDGKLFSYATCIAEIYNGTVIFNEASYSNTTSKHQSLARSAARHYKAIYIEVPKRGLNSLAMSQRDFNEIIVDYNERKASEYLVKATRARKPETETVYLGTAHGIFSSLIEYAQLLGLEYNAPDLETLKESASKAYEQALALEKVRKAERIREQAEALENWRAGHDVRNYFELTALRVKADQIETTHGARIPVEHAVKFWPYIRSWHETGTPYIRGQHSIHLGNYTVNSFNDDVLTVGCHKIPYSEIEGIARILNI